MDLMCAKIETYAELQKMIRKALHEQHPEWIDAHGESAICASYETRFAELLVLFEQGSKSAALFMGLPVNTSRPRHIGRQGKAQTNPGTVNGETRTV
jgi:hypothetical protein